MIRLLGKWGAQRAALLISGLLLVALFLIPFTSRGGCESISVLFGGWELWYPGYTDGGDWVPVEPEIKPTGSDAALQKAMLEEDGRSDGAYVDEYPNSLPLRALHVYRVIRRHSLHLVNNVDSPIRDEVNPKDVERLTAAQPIFRRIIEVAAKGEQQEPDNAFFPIAQAVAYEGLRDIAAVEAAAERAAECLYYNDYSMRNGLVIRRAISDVRASRYYEFYDTTVGGSEFLWELRTLARLWSNRTGDQALRLQGHFIDLCPLLAKSALTRADVNTIRTAIKDCGVTEATFKREYNMGRRPNDGDLYRNLTTFQNTLVGAGLAPKIDVPAFFGVEPRADLTDYGIDRGTSFEWRDRAWWALLFYAEYVIIGASVLFALAALACFVPLLFVLGKASRLRMPVLGIAPMAAAVFSAILAADNSGQSGALLLMTAVFIVAFVMSLFPKVQFGSIALGAGACLLSVLSVLFVEAEYSPGIELVPAAVYVIGLGRYYWLRNKSPSRGWTLATLGIAFAASGAEIRFSEFGWNNVTDVALMLLLALASVSAWHCLQPSEACRRLLRSIPFAVLIAVGVFVYISARQQLLVNEMDHLAGVEAEMVDEWRMTVSKVGPPLDSR